jgi:hypothetical protein
MTQPFRQRKRSRHRKAPDYPLQPLRMGTGWKVAWNQFYELDPPTDWERDVETVFFSDDRLLLQSQQRRILIDLGWVPYGPRGRFVLSAINWLGDDECPANGTAPSCNSARARGRGSSRPSTAGSTTTSTGPPSSASAAPAGPGR